jgi:hypothetical protein
MNTENNILSDAEFIRKYAKWQYEQYPEILEREAKLNYEIDKMMNQKQNINKQDAKLEKPRNSAGSSYTIKNE